MDYKYNYNNYSYDIKRRGAPKRYNGRGKGRTLRLWLCLGIFALAVGVRVLAPEFSRRVSGQVLETINSSVDYRAAFAAVGSFVSGEYTLGETVAVLKNGGGAAAEVGEVSAELPEPSGAAANNLQTMYLQCLDARLKRRQQEEAAPAAAVEGGAVIYGAEEQPLPENVCAEMVELPFDYARPVPGECSAAFGYRQHPREGEEKFHYGMDFAADEGEDIEAFADGYVAASGVSETAGKYLIISHGDGWSTQYFHCSEVYATGGTEVKMGDVVAAAGQTGNATGPHLHFELIRDGVYYDPGLYLNEQG